MGELIYLQDYKAKRILHVRKAVVTRAVSGNYSSVPEDLIKPLEEKLAVELNKKYPFDNNDDFYFTKRRIQDNVYDLIFRSKDGENIPDKIEELFLSETMYALYNSYKTACSRLIERKKSFNKPYTINELNYFFKNNLVETSYKNIDDCFNYLSVEKCRSSIPSAVFSVYVTINISKDFVDDRTKNEIKNWPNYKYFDEIIKNAAQEIK
jgi:hypothetical protein